MDNTIKLCSVDECGRKHKGHGLCDLHLLRKRKGIPLDRPLRSQFSNPIEAFEFRSMPVSETGCVIWLGSISDRGYGKMYSNGKYVYAHRFAYEKAHGSLPDGLQLDHICHVRCCVNPAHLRPATNKQNHENLKGSRSDSRSGIRGAVWSSQKNKYAAQVWHHGKRYHLGFYEDPVQAGMVASAKRAELYTHYTAVRRASP